MAAEKDFPRGHKRDEFNRQQADAAEQAREELANETGAVDLDPAKLDAKNVDNEIARWVDIQKGNVPVSNPHPAYDFIWVTVPDGYSMQAQTSIRAMEARLRSAGYFPVTDDVADLRNVGKEHKGQARATGTLRGVGDTILFAIRKEDKARLNQMNLRKSLRDQGVEDAAIDIIVRQGAGATAGFNLNDPRMARLYGEAGLRPITYSAQFSQRQIREGTGPLSPGFELQRGR